MVVIRGTRKLLQRLGMAPSREAARASTTKLGDWTANIVVERRQHLVLAVSQRTLLPVLLSLAPSKTFLMRFPDAVRDTLTALGVSEDAAASEVAAMSERVVAVTNDRTVLGSLNDFSQMLPSYLDGGSLLDAALQLSRAPCSPIGMERPRDVARAAFTPTLRLVK